MYGSPYKRQLETSAALKEKTTNNVTRIMLSFTHKEVHSSDEDEDKGQDAECIYCSRLFSRDKKGEKWIRCTKGDQRGRCDKPVALTSNRTNLQHISFAQPHKSSLSSNNYRLLVTDERIRHFLLKMSVMLRSADQLVSSSEASGYPSEFQCHSWKPINTIARSIFTKRNNSSSFEFFKAFVDG
ncbi:hypothetical protein C0J52_05409 [Blattella germanica]|nr:hypothetical protein C0J52_05409 [Blattella germanica]